MSAEELAERCDAVEPSRPGRSTLRRTFAILRALETAPDGLTLAELTLRAGLPRSTVHRLVAALQAQGFVELAARTDRLRLGAGLLRLCAAAHEVERRARPRPEARA